VVKTRPKNHSEGSFETEIFQAVLPCNSSQLVVSSTKGGDRPTNK